MSSMPDGQELQLGGSPGVPAVPPGWGGFGEGDAASALARFPATESELAHLVEASGVAETQHASQCTPTLPEQSQQALVASSCPEWDATGNSQKPSTSIVATAAAGAAAAPDDAAIVAAGAAATDDDASVAETPKHKKLGPGQQHAILKYAEAHSLSPDDVTLAMVEQSPEKTLYWACKDINWGARDAVSQAFYRSFKTDAPIVAKNIYDDLDDKLKKEYRQVWNLQRDFDFTTEKKRITLAYSKSSAELGSLMTREQIAVELGLAGYPTDGPERQKILDMAKNYTMRCYLFGGRWLKYNNWLGEDTFLYIKHMFTNTCKKTWEMIAENTTEVNVWAQKAKESKARRALALSLNKHIDSVSVDDVHKAEGGLEHWASVSINIEQAGGKSKAKAKPKAKAEAGSAAGTKSLNVLEKNLKGMIAQEMLLQKGTDDLMAQKSSAPDKWTWAEQFINDCAAKRQEVAELKSTGFLAKFVAAALSPDALKNLKKESADNYHTELVRSVDTLKTPLEEWSDKIGKMKAMAIGAGLGEEDAGETPKKKKRKA